MSLLTIVQGLARNVGLPVPDLVVTASNREWVEALELSALCGEELARRVDWGVLHTTTTLTGTGANVSLPLGANFSRVRSVSAVTNSDGSIVRPLSRAEWATLTPQEGIPRYYLLEGQNVTLWPYLATGSTATVSGQSKAWCSNGTDAWTNDTETALVDEGLIQKGLIVRWRRQKGMEYADYEAEYEASLADLAGFDEGSRP